MKLKPIYLSLFLFFFANCGNEINEQDTASESKTDRRDLPTVDINKINESLTNIGHKTVCAFRNDTLSIDLYLTEEDFSSKYYPDVLIELIICNISNHVYPNHKVKIVRCFENGTRNSPEFLDYTLMAKIAAVNKVRIYYDFKKYLVLNVKGDKISKLNFIIENLIKNRKSKNPINVKDNDFIQAALSYATYYCIPEKKDDFYKKLLEAIKEVAQDKEVWPNFNPQDIDYFLDYCDNSKHA